MPYAFANGSGTEADPYQVWTAEDLDGVRDYLDAHFIQKADIDLLGWDWTPIGIWSAGLTGGYDGNYHSIKNLNINKPSNSSQGLFGSITGTSAKRSYIKNLTMINPVVIGYRFNAPLSSQIIYGDVTNISIVNVYAESKDNRGGYQNGSAAGLVSDTSSSSIINCYVIGGTVKTAGGWSGGIAGQCGSDLIDCYSNGVTVQGAFEWMGGLCGSFWATMTRCYSTNKVIGLPDSGGLIGRRVGTVTKSYYDTETSGYSDTGYGTPKTTAEMKQQATFIGWDFDTVWGIDPAINDGYPYLQWQDFGSAGAGRQIFFPAKFPRKYP